MSEFLAISGGKKPGVIDTRMLRFISLSGLHSDFRHSWSNGKCLPIFLLYYESRCCDFKVEGLQFKWRCLTTNTYEYTRYNLSLQQPSLCIALSFIPIFSFLFLCLSPPSPSSLALTPSPIICLYVDLLLFWKGWQRFVTLAKLWTLRFSFPEFN